MNTDLIIADEMVIILLLLITIFASMTLRYMRIPYTIGLVIIGYVLSAFIFPNFSVFSPLEGIVPGPEILLYIFLPPLIFESAINVNTRLLGRYLFPVLTLATVGVLISTCIIGYILSWVLAIPLFYMLLFGALISATDPAAVISIFKEIGVPRRLHILVEGESLLNDAAAIVAFQMFLTLISTSLIARGFTLEQSSRMFTSELVSSFFGGIVVGAAVGMLLSHIIRRTPLHPHIHQTATVVAAYLSYIVTDHMLGYSGVLAVVVCGCIAAQASTNWIGPARREELSRFWEYIGFLANSLIFLLVGISVATLQDFTQVIRGGTIGIIVVIGAVTLARFVSVFGILSALNPITDRKIPLSYQAVASWGGLRGGVAIALAFSLPFSLPYREAIIGFTTIIVIFTILVQGLTIGPFIRVLGLGKTSLERRLYVLQARLISSKSAKSSLVTSDFIPIVEREKTHQCISHYEQEADEQFLEIRRVWEEARKYPGTGDVVRMFWREALRYEQILYQKLFDEGLVLPSVFFHLSYLTTLREDRIQSGEYDMKERKWALVSRIRLLIVRILKRVGPESYFTRYMATKDQITYILTAYGVAYAATGTIRHLRTQADEFGLDQDAIVDIIGSYEEKKERSIRYLRSEQEKHPEIFHKIGTYLIVRTAKAGILNSLNERLAEEAGDKKTLENHIRDLVHEKNSAERDLIHSSIK